MMHFDDIVVVAFSDFVVIEFLEIEDGRYWVGFAKKMSVFVFPEFAVGQGFLVEPVFPLEGVDDGIVVRFFL